MPDISKEAIRRDKIRLRRKAIAARKMLRELKAEQKEINARDRLRRNQESAATEQHVRARELEALDLVDIMISEGEFTEGEWEDYQRGDMAALRNLIASAQPLRLETMGDVKEWVKAAATLALPSQLNEEEQALAILEDATRQSERQLESPVWDLVLQKIRRGVRGGENRQTVVLTARQRIQEIYSGDGGALPRRPLQEKRRRDPIEVHVIESSQETGSRHSHIKGSLGRSAARSVTPKDYASRFERVEASADQLRETAPGEVSASMTRIRSTPSGGTANSTPGGKDAHGFFLKPTPNLFKGLQGELRKRWAKDPREAIRNIMLSTAETVLFREEWNPETQDFDYWIRFESFDVIHSPFMMHVVDYKSGNENRKRTWIELLSLSGTKFDLTNCKIHEVEAMTMCAIIVIGEIKGIQKTNMLSHEIVSFAHDQASRLLGRVVTTVADLVRECQEVTQAQRAPSKRRQRGGGNAQVHARPRPPPARQPNKGKNGNHGSGGFPGRCDLCGVIGHKKMACPQKKG